jgi:hypothetical protein
MPVNSGSQGLFPWGVVCNHIIFGRLRLWHTFPLFPATSRSQQRNQAKSWPPFPRWVDTVAGGEDDTVLALDTIFLRYNSIVTFYGWYRVSLTCYTRYTNGSWQLRVTKRWFLWSRKGCCWLMPLQKLNFLLLLSAGILDKIDFGLPFWLIVCRYNTAVTDILNDTLRFWHWHLYYIWRYLTPDVSSSLPATVGGCINGYLIIILLHCLPPRYFGFEQRRADLKWEVVRLRVKRDGDESRKRRLGRLARGGFNWLCLPHLPKIKHIQHDDEQTRGSPSASTRT